ncbi:hypothetical protein EYZ11_013013 [Aspergillus tanneri]|uniref:Uncharacterized protein n=1 Tax=Aspergillus tanneri TaxID=1220188 RepID=A0A4S3IYR6_9EURO|nr:hypothetical protein EYZ11_013013 [Aspergillus tanneri]
MPALIITDIPNYLNSWDRELAFYPNVVEVYVRIARDVVA